SARGLPAWLRSRRQRPDRYRAGLAADPARRGIRLTTCTGAVRASTSRPAVVRAHVPRSRRALAWRQQGGAYARALSRRRTWAARLAAEGARPRGLQPGHDDVAACRVAPGNRTGSDCRLFRHARAAKGRPTAERGQRNQITAAGVVGAWRSG